MYELPTLNDSHVLAIIGAHPEEFFEAMKEFEPYIIIRVGATELEIKLKNSYVDLEKLRATFKRLDSLGYHPYDHTSIYTMPNGVQVVELDSITIDWKGRGEVGGQVMPTHEENHSLDEQLSKLVKAMNLVDEAYKWFSETNWDKFAAEDCMAIQRRIGQLISDINDTQRFKEDKNA